MPLLVAVVVVPSLATGCGTSGGVAVSPDVALVLGVHANAGTMTSSPELASLAHRLANLQAHVTLIEDDGAPWVVTELDLTVDAPNPLWQTQEIAANSSLILSTIAGIRPRTAETDPLSSLALAARAVSGGVDPQIYVFDSGLQTTGSLPLEQPGLLDDSPTTLVSVLREGHELPSLAGTSVTWWALSDTTSPQQPLTTPMYDQLTALWTTVLRGSRAASVTLIPTPLPAAAAVTGGLTVSPVPIPTDTSAAAPLVVSLAGSSVNFVADEAVFSDPSSAQGALRVTAQAILAGGYTQVQVSGHTATEDLPGDALSLGRAHAVSQVLAADGVPASEITCVGVGDSYFPGQVPDTDLATGALIPAAAEADRVVVVSASH
jgi:outer membrane protein OmpA-like peptidoglycan-associated protein